MIPAGKGHPLNRIRILLAGIPPLLVDILHHIVASEPDMAVVGRVSDGDLFAAAKSTGADVILIGQKAKEGGEQYEELLLRRPRLKVLTIADDGKTGALYELRPQRISLGEVSADVLCAAIRGRPPMPSADRP
jgi:DNA-binding NarL/FixJ family response regulator